MQSKSSQEDVTFNACHVYTIGETRNSDTFGDWPKHRLDVFRLSTCFYITTVSGAIALIFLTITATDNTTTTAASTADTTGYLSCMNGR